MSETRLHHQGCCDKQKTNEHKQAQARLDPQGKINDMEKNKVAEEWGCIFQLVHKGEEKK